MVLNKMTKKWFFPCRVWCIWLLLPAMLFNGCITIQKNDGIPKSSPPVAQEELVIKLERTACFGKCPVYSLMIKGDGTVIYAGVDFVRVKGIQETSISADAVKQLVLAFEKADYFSLKDSYTSFGVSDMPSVNTSINIGNKTKAVNHYLGDRNAPKQLSELENKIDEIVNSAQWIK